MKNLIILFISICLLLTACTSKSNLNEPFITNDPEELEKYASKALQQAQFKLDSLRKTELLQEQQSD
jgi:outer membrane biogenesis lipoprotein LolB